MSCIALVDLLSAPSFEYTFTRGLNLAFALYNLEVFVVSIEILTIIAIPLVFKRHLDLLMETNPRVSERLIVTLLL